MATTRAAARASAPHRSIPLVLLGALLCAFVIAIHVIDQGGVTGLADPPYKGYLYYALEIGAAITALVLLSRRAALIGWVLALGVSVGPIVGYIASRSIGLPNYTDDIGNWTEPLGLTALSVEGLLLICALIALVSAARQRAARR